MTFFGMALLTAAGTFILAAFAIVTAWYARKAFLKQSQEVRAIESQVADGQQLTRQQGELIKIQTGQLEALRGQLEEQRKASDAQAEVLELQASELRESLEERKCSAEKERRGQAALVTAWFASFPVPTRGPAFSYWGAAVRNASDLPVFDVRVSFYFIEEPVAGMEWTPVLRGSAPKAIQVLPPQDERSVYIPDDIARQDECSDQVYAVGITFADAAGNNWERDPRGALKPLS